MQPYDSTVRDITALSEIHQGCTYLVEERRPKQSLEICERLAQGGASLQIVSRDPPGRLLERMIAAPKSTIWLTSMPGDGRIDPTSIGILMSEIRKFVERKDQHMPVVLIDGMEYLMSLNTYDRMLQFIHQLRDIFAMSSATLIIPMDVRTLSEREQALLERNLEVISAAPPAIDMDQGGSMIQVTGDSLGT